ncbi:MAG TPA: hypothetical protein VFB60_13015 [Ktedonobacteraceae bacterium]|nr:hypothetical protein [Ktedonobacteraceae bacterium]
MLLRRSFTTWALTAFLLLTVTGLLTACGGTASSSTSASTGTAAKATPSATARAGAVTGTVDAYNASTQSLILKLPNGSTQTFQTTHARIVEDQKVTQQQLGEMLNKSGIVVFEIGPKTSDGTYNAQVVVVSLTMGASTAPQNTTRLGNNRVFLLHTQLKNNELLAEDTNGHAPITVKLSGTTALIAQTEGIASDLQAGQMIVVVPGSSPGGTVQAAQILIGPLPRA